MDPAYPDAVSNIVNEISSQVSPSVYGNLTIDVHAPVTSLLNVSWNNTVRPTNNETVGLSCGRATNESVLGCRILYNMTRNGVVVASQAPAVMDASVNTVGSVAVRSVNGDVVLVTFWAVDAAGNVGPPTVLTWSVDSVIPYTNW